MTPIISAPNIQTAPLVQVAAVNGLPASIPSDSRIVYNAVNASISTPEIFNNAKNPAPRVDQVRQSQTKENTVVPASVALTRAPSENFGFSTLFMAQLFGQEVVGDRSVIDTFAAANNPVYEKAGVSGSVGPLDAGAGKAFGPLDASANSQAVGVERPEVAILKLTPSMITLASKLTIITPSAIEVASAAQGSVSSAGASTSYLKPGGISGYIATAVRNDINLSEFPPVFVSI